MSIEIITSLAPSSHLQKTFSKRLKPHKVNSVIWEGIKLWSPSSAQMPVILSSILKAILELN